MENSIITKSAVTQMLFIQGAIKEEGRKIAEALGLKGHWYSCFALDKHLVIPRYGLGEKNIELPIAVLWDDALRAETIAAWRAENDPELLDRAKLKELLAKYGPDCKACRG